MRALSITSLVLLLPNLALAAGPADYTRDIKPLLAKHCLACHGPDKQRASLRLDSHSLIRKGGNTGPALVPGQSGQSLIIHVLTGVENVPSMPPKGPKVSPQEIALLRAWIDSGANAPAGEGTTVVTQVKGGHWSFRPIVRPAEPAVKQTGWVRTPIDRFILARLEKEGIRPAPEADRTTLIRRVSLDLTGLPPSPREVEQFLADSRPDAYERLVDRLLASPHYGERWGRHWLDLARYADSNGYSIDSARSIWKYRDWVIDALNRDLPFDRFAIEQLAGDLLPDATLDQRIATGFHRNTQINQEGGIDVEQFRVESIVDRVGTTGSVFLGLTVGCCQCHDHKFDPLSQREFYQFFAFFNTVDEPTLELATPEQSRRRQQVQAGVAALEKKLKTLDTATLESLEKWEGNLNAEARTQLPKAIQTILAIAPNGRTAKQEQALLTAYRNIDQVRHVLGGMGNPLPFLSAAHLTAMSSRRGLEEKILNLKKDVPVIATTLVVQERKTPRVTNIHLGGDFLRKGAVVGPQTPAVLPPLANRPGLSRLDLGRWLVDGRNPLTARVAVNRFWQQYFGLGLVETENDFGTQGTPPSHPELLDWLAAEFMARGWSMKTMHRLITTSSVYRQSSNLRPDLLGVDARNRLLARQQRLRLDAEVIRDTALASSGLLSEAVGGPSVFPPQPPGVYALTQVPKDWKPSPGSDRYRRGLYTHLWRSAPHPGLTVFDAPDATAACTRRNRSNTPLQALTLLNDQGFLEFAQVLAVRLFREGGESDEARLEYAFRLCLARAPREPERQVLLRLLARQQSALAAEPQEAARLVPADRPQGVDVPRLAAWTMAARVLLNLDEFITRE